MEDQQIVSLYWQREEAAIEQTDKKYGRYLTKIACNILSDLEDSKESVNDTYLDAWNSMPPQRPSVLSTYLSKITRRVSIDRLRRRTSKKRGGGAYILSLSELSDSFSEGDTTQQAVSEHMLTQAIADYLRTLPQQSRNAFLCRYFYMDSLRDVARYCEMTEAKAKMLLFRCRQGLAEHLRREGLL